MNSKSILIWVIYDNPKDFPGKFVVRKFHNDVPEKDAHAIEDTLDAARLKLPEGLVHLPRHEADDTCIVECWI